MPRNILHTRIEYVNIHERKALFRIKFVLFIIGFRFLVVTEMCQQNIDTNQNCDYKAYIRDFSQTQ